MLLQIAFDKPEHLALLPQMKAFADIIEIGTPVLKRFGVSAITTARELCPDIMVLADTKTVDGGQFEADMVFGAGAAFMTVLSCASRATHEVVGKRAAAFGATVIVDTITKSGKAELLPPDAVFPESYGYVAVHSPTDARLAGDTSTSHIDAVRKMHARGFLVSLAGGIGPDTLRRGDRSRTRDRRRRQRHHGSRKPERDSSMDSREIAQSRPWLAVGQEIEELLGRIDADAFARLVQAFDDPGQRWFFSGQGRSGLAAQMAAMRFMHLGRTVHFVGEVSAPSIRKGDALLIISGSGETAVSTGFARIAKAEGAKVVTLTHKPAGTLAGIADVVLHVPVETTAQFGGSLFEQCCLILLDSVVLGLARQMHDAHALMLHRHTNLQ